MRRLPVESTRTIQWFAALRIAVVAIALAGLAVFDVSERESLVLLAALAGVPFALGVLLLSSRAPAIALHPAIAMIDLTILAAAEAISPDTYGAVRFLALFLIAAHAHFQGALRGTALALAAVILLVPTAVIEAPVSGDLLAWYETLFATAALAAALFIGRLRSAESAGRLRARELSRRVLETEGQVRRRLATALHEGPVQELVSLDLILDAARRALESGRTERAEELLGEARLMAERNIGSLREEIVSLGPYALDELTLDTALEQCSPVWARRFGVPVELHLDRINLSNELCGFLFGIAQEAVANAGRHAGPDRIDVFVKRLGDEVELRVADDGHGFNGDVPLGPEQPGHIGLATMRERAELAGGRLAIDTGDGGTTVVVRAPLVESG